MLKNYNFQCHHVIWPMRWFNTNACCEVHAYLTCECQCQLKSLPFIRFVINSLKHFFFFFFFYTLKTCFGRMQRKLNKKAIRMCRGKEQNHMIQWCVLHVFKANPHTKRPPYYSICLHSPFNGSYKKHLFPLCDWNNFSSERNYQFGRDKKNANDDNEIRKKIQVQNALLAHEPTKKGHYHKWVIFLCFYWIIKIVDLQNSSLALDLSSEKFQR